MRAVGSRLVLALACVLLLAPAASAATRIESRSTDGDRTLRQQLNVFAGGTVHYWIAAADPDGFGSYCVNLQLERRGSEGWKPAGSGSQARSRDCFETTAKTKVYWDSFVYPRGALRRGLKNGNVRAHARTSLGGSLIFRASPRR